VNCCECGNKYSIYKECWEFFFLAQELLDFQGLRPSKLDSWILDLASRCEKRGTVFNEEVLRRKVGVKDG
jgi:hypothetical protein